MMCKFQRSKGKKQKHHQRGESDERTTTSRKSNSDDIEEQLRRQRLKRQCHNQNQETDGNNNSETNSEATTVQPRLGGYIYDTERGAYFKESFLQKERREREEKKEDKSTNISKASVKVRNSSHVVAYHREIWGGTNHRQKVSVIAQWRGRHFLERIRPITWNLGGRSSISENTQSIDSPQWTKTLCVSEGQGNGPFQQYVYSPDFGWWSHYLAGNERASLHVKVLDKNNNTIMFIKSYSRCTSHSVSDAFGSTAGILQLGTNERSFTKLNEFLVPEELTDCTEWYGGPEIGAGVVIWSGSKGDLYLSNNEYHCNIKKSKMLPKSDTLTLESHQTIPHSLVRGHRNGQICMEDIRAKSNSCSSLTGVADFGSIVALKLLFTHRPHQLLARGYNGCCRLYDVRMFGQVKSPTSKNFVSDPSLIFELRLPTCLQKKYSRSKGIATDPYQTLGIYPFVDRALTGRLALWSLDTGEFVGSKSIQDSRLNNHHSATIKVLQPTVSDCLELCPTITKAWSKDSYRPKAVPGAYSLWLQWGSRGTYQIVCDGRADC